MNNKKNSTKLTSVIVILAMLILQLETVLATNLDNVVTFNIIAKNPSYYINSDGIIGLQNGELGVSLGEYDSGWSAQSHYFQIFDANATKISEFDFADYITPRTNDHSDTIVPYGLSNGNIVLCWYSSSSGKGFTAAYFIIIEQTGNIVKNATLINNEVGELNRFVQIAQLSNGDIAFVWATSGSNYAMRIFDSSGNAKGNQISVTTLGTGTTTGSMYNHQIAADKDGTFMIVYNCYNSYTYKAILFNNDGTPKTVEGVNHFSISDVYKSGSAQNYVTALSNGNFLVAFLGEPDYPNANSYTTRDSRIAIFTPNGTKVKEQILEVIGNSYIDQPIAFADGGYAIPKYDANYSMFVDVYDNDGNLVASSKQVSNPTEYMVYAIPGREQGLATINFISDFLEVKLFGFDVAHTYSITAIENQTLTEVPEGYASGAQDTKTIDVINSGTGALSNLAVSLDSGDITSFDITQPTLTDLNSGGQTSFTVKAKDLLSPGTYTATVKVEAVNMTPVTFNITQTVNAKPTATGVSISGIPRAGQQLFGAYTYNDYENNTQGETTFKWYRSDDITETNKTSIATTQNYTLANDDIGKYISFEVTPVATSGALVGDSVESDMTTVVLKNIQSSIVYNDITKTYGDTSFNHTATGGDGTGAFSYESSDSTVAEIDSSTGNVIIHKAGSVNITATKAGDSNYDEASQTSILTINKAQLTATVGDYSKTYGDENPSFEVTVTGFVNDETAADATDYVAPTASSSATATTDVGTASITISGGSADNYEFNVSDTGTLTINQKLLTATATANSKTYDGNTSATGTISLDGKVGADDITASGTFTFESADAGVNKTVNITDITLSGAKKDNYTVNTTATATATINKASIDGITFSNSTVTYDGTEKSIEITGTLPSGASVDYTGNKGTNAGTYDAIATIIGGTNYNETVLNATLTINKAQLVATVGDYSKTYGDENPSFEVAVTGFVNGETAATAAGYSAPTASSSATATTNVGTASITISGGSADNYEFNISDTGTLTINKAQLTATVGDYSKTYGDENPDFEVAVTGFVNGETSATATGYVSPTASSLATATTDVGAEIITISGGSADNYEFNTSDTGTLTINQKLLTATATANSKTYDGNTSTIGAISLEGKVGDDDVTASGTFNFESANADNNKTVNVTDITLSGAKKDNYTVNSTAAAAADINKANISGITFSDLTVTYDGTEKTIEITGTLPSGASVDYTNNKGTNAGTYNAIATITGGTNYNETVLNATLTINKAQLVATVADYSKTYGDENPDFEVAVTGFVNGETAATAAGYSAPTASSSATATTNVGTASISISGGSAYNYEFNVSDTGTLTINQKLLTATATANSKTYDGNTSTTGTVSLEGKVGTDDVTASGTFAFEDKDAGINKTVNVTGITLNGSNVANYTLNGVTTATANADIAVKALTITPDSNQSKVYGNAEPTLTYTTNGLVTDDSLTGALSRAIGENVGSYAINQGTLDNSNYAIAVVPVDFEVTQKSLTIENITVSKTYDGTTAATAFVTGATLSGVINDDDVSLVSTNMTAIFASSALGEHDITITGYEITGAKTGNYYITQPTGVKGTIVLESASDIILSVDTNGYDGSWTREDVTITLSATAPSGINEYQFTTNDGETWETLGSNILTINTQTDSVYKFRAVSNGNVASNASDGVEVKVDITKPIVENIEGNPTTSVNTNQAVTFSARDLHSGINAQTVTVKNGETNVEVTKNGDVYSFVTQGNGQYKVSISDNAGNISDEITVDVTMIDFDKPIINTLSPFDGETDVDTQQISITFNESIKKAGINGDIAIYKANGSVFERIDALNNRVKISDKTMTVHLSKALNTNSGYYVHVAGNIIADTAGNTFDGITSKTAWDFKTKSVSEIIGLLGLDLVVDSKQFPAIADENDETKYASVAKPNSDDTIDFTIVPKLTNTSADIKITTTQAGVLINGKTIKVTDTTLNTIPLTIKVKKPDGSVDDSKTYSLVLQRGTVEAKITTKDLSATVDSTDIIGTVDTIQDVQAGKQVELVLNVENNANQVTNEVKNKIQEAVGNGTIPVFVDISLSIVVDNTKTAVTHTQNPLTIRIEIPSNMRGGSNYKVVRMHNGEVEVLDTTVVGNYLVFTTDRFSQYAISYIPSVKDDDNKDSTKKSSSSGSSGIRIMSSKEHTAYINGYEDGTFRPDATITRAEATAILARVSTDYNNQYYASGFSDASGWSSNYIGFASQKGLVNGYEDGTFKPDANMTRAEFATVIAKFLGLGKKEGSNFADSQNHWAIGYISALVEKGIINGYEDNTFKPDASITRAEAVKVINAALGRTPNIARVQENIPKYTVAISDVPTTHWAYYEIIEAAVSHDEADFN